MTDDYQIRSVVPEDVPEILSLLRLSLGESRLLKRTPELFAWKHTLNPFGPSIALAATKAGQIVGVRMFMRWELLTPDGSTLRCVRAVDTATHPDHERKGLFRKLTLSALEVARADGVDLVFNTPNPQSGAGYLKMGWKEVGWIGGLVRLRVGPTPRVEEDLSPDLGETVPASKPFTPIESPDREPLGLRTRRTMSYQEWRFTGHPTARYGWVEDEAEGGAVVRASVRRGRVETIVTDLLAGGGREVVARTVRSSRARYVAAWFSDHSPERASVRAAGLIPVPRLKALRLVAFPISHIPFDVLDLGSWDLATSDLELL